jgi:hypothetical protein
MTSFSKEINMAKSTPTATESVTEGYGHLTANEASFVADLTAFYRRAGDAAAWRLVDKMNTASENGCYREDRRLTVKAALSKLPTVH